MLHGRAMLAANWRALPGSFPQPPPDPQYPDPSNNPPPLTKVNGWAAKGDFPGKGRVKNGKLAIVEGDASSYVLDAGTSFNRWADAAMLDITHQQGVIAPLVADNNNWIGTRLVPGIISPGTHRGWRIYITAATGTPHLDISEIEMRTSAGVDVTSTAFAIYSAQTSGFEATKSFDDTTATTWYINQSTYPLPQWIGQDFGAGNEQEIVDFRLTCWNKNEMVSTFELQYSDDLSSWTTCMTYTTVPAWTTGETRTFSTGGTLQPSRLQAVKKVNGVETVLATASVAGLTANDRVGGIVYSGDYYITRNRAVVGGPYAIC